MITVMGATGRVGRRIVAALAPGERVRAVSRSPRGPAGPGVDRCVGDAADDALRTRERTGVVELLGPRDLTQTEVAALLGEHLGRPGLPYVQLPEAEMVDALVGAVFSPDAAERHVGMTRALNEGRIAGHRTAGNTTSTRFEDVVGEWVA
ncbi:hypothetical protein ACVGOW_17060 [Pseudonocardia saturnea]